MRILHPRWRGRSLRALVRGPQQHQRHCITPGDLHSRVDPGGRGGCVPEAGVVVPQCCIVTRHVLSFVKFQCLVALSDQFVLSFGKFQCLVELSVQFVLPSGSNSFLLVAGTASQLSENFRGTFHL